MLDEEGKIIPKEKGLIQCRCCRLPFPSYDIHLNQMCPGCLKHGEYYNQIEGCPVLLTAKAKAADLLRRKKKKRR